MTHGMTDTARFFICFLKSTYGNTLTHMSFATLLCSHKLENGNNLNIYLYFFFCSCEKYSDQIIYWMNSLVWLIFQGCCPSQSRMEVQDIQKDCHIASTTRMQEIVYACTYSAPFFFSLQDVILESVPPTSVGLPTSINTVKALCHRLAQRPSSQVILHSAGRQFTLTVTMPINR